MREKTSHHDSLTEDEPEACIAQPGHRHIGIGKARGNQQRIMRTLLILDNNLMVGQGNQAHSIDKIAEDMAPLGFCITSANLGTQQALEAAGHEGQLQITGDLHGPSGGQSIHMEKVNAIGDTVCKHHALCIAFDERRGGTAYLIGQE